MILKTPQHERPRERCLRASAQCLSLRECLAILLGSGPPGQGALGLATRLLTQPGEGLGPCEEEIAFFTSLESRGTAYLNNVSGLGPAGQAKILAAFEIGRRYALFRNPIVKPDLVSLTVPEVAARALNRVSPENRASPQEWLGFVPFYRSAKVGELCIVERGIRTHVNVDPAELFARILAVRPSGIVLFHNHPSGWLVPSNQDIELTTRVEGLAFEFGIQLIGHWIVASEGEFWIPSRPPLPV